MKMKKRQMGNAIIGLGAVLVVVAMTPVPSIIAIVAIPLAVVAFTVGIALALSKA